MGGIFFSCPSNPSMPLALAVQRRLRARVSRGGEEMKLSSRGRLLPRARRPRALRPRELLLKRRDARVLTFERALRALVRGSIGLEFLLDLVDALPGHLDNPWGRCGSRPRARRSLLAPDRYDQGLLLEDELMGGL